MMKTLINGLFYRINDRNQITYHGQCVPIVQDIYGSFWVIIDGHLHQLRTFTQDGLVCYFKGTVPDFICNAPVSNLAKELDFELSELDQYWNLDRTEFYMLVTYRVSDER